MRSETGSKAIAAARHAYRQLQARTALRQQELLAELRDAATLELINRATRDLPDGWRIRVEVSKDAWSVSLFDENGKGQNFPTNDESVEEAFVDALEYAMGLDTR